MAEPTTGSEDQGATPSDDAKAPEDGAPPQDRSPAQSAPATDDPFAQEASAEKTAASAEPRKPLPPPVSKAAKGGKLGLIPLVLGVVLVVGIFFTGAWYVQNRGLAPATRGTAPIGTGGIEARLAAVEARLLAMPEYLDPVELDERITALASDIGDVFGQILVDIAEIDDRLSALELMPAGDGTMSEGAVAAWGSEVEALRAALGAQQAEMEQLASQTAERLAQAQEAVAGMEQAIVRTANDLLRRAAVTRVEAGLDAGSGFASALDELARMGIAIPPVLTAVATNGLPTLAMLQDAFPTSARAALAAARSEGVADEDSNPVVAFLRDTLDVRSVEPRDGADVDAVLSRAEAALRTGQLDRALMELDALPEPALAAMSNWIAAAQIRLAAISAVGALSQSSNAE
ncbi:MAG: hypothetical protein JJT81_14010 [Rubellimicrobium sp.]|nr:hypothetical protein [Rubellimicrobium sp.]